MSIQGIFINQVLIDCSIDLRHVPHNVLHNCHCRVLAGGFFTPVLAHWMEKKKKLNYTCVPLEAICCRDKVLRGGSWD